MAVSENAKYVSTLPKIHCCEFQELWRTRWAETETKNNLERLMNLSLRNLSYESFVKACKASTENKSNLSKNVSQANSNNRQKWKYKIRKQVCS